jgi:long-chain acyl-CoA synthetase
MSRASETEAETTARTNSPFTTPSASPQMSPSKTQPGLSPGVKTFATSRASLREGFADASGGYRRRLADKKVAIMPDGKFTFEYDESGLGPKPGEGLPRRHPLAQDAGLLETYSPNVCTLYESFANSVERSSNNPYLGTRTRNQDGTFGEYTWETYGQVYEKVKALGAALVHTFALPANAAVGLYSINRAEWCITEQACFATSLVTVPLYDTLGDESIHYICSQTEMPVIFTSADKLRLLSRMTDRLAGTLKHIVSFDPVPEDVRQTLAATGIGLVCFSELLAAGEETAFEARPPKRSDLCTICYTSGTTGWPKGVMLPHSAMLADASACLALCGYGPSGFTADQRSLFELRADDVHISYLPLAHIFERVVMTALTTVGASIGFYQGDTLKLMDDIAVLRPTIFVSVPRLFNRVYDKVLGAVKEQGGLAALVFNWAYASKVAALRESGALTHWLWDRAVFAKIRARLGGRVRAMLSGSAPIAPEVMEFLRVCFGCEVYEGYGQTETSAGTCLTIRHDWTTGHVGIPVPSNEIKLVDVPEMGYTSADRPRPRGEICVRGPSCFVGYYRDAEKTAEALDAAGWVHSGDIGEWDERGRLRVIDRKKNLFKLSQGEYIAPERVEAVLTKSPFIAQAFLHGDSLKSSTVAVLVPDREALLSWARGVAVSAESVASAASDGALATLPYEELCVQPMVHELLLKEVSRFGRRGSNELKGFEIPRAIHVEARAFSVENGLLTATFKLKRNNARAHYTDTIAQLYASIEERE